MASKTDNKKEWFAKARIDYFSPFLNLWLACNSWYNFHYTTDNNDREHINILKTDTSKRNILFKNFEEIFKGDNTKKRVSLFDNLKLLHYSLSNAEIKPKDFSSTSSLNFSNMLIDFSKKTSSDGYKSIIIKDSKNKNGKLKPKFKNSVIDLGEIVISNNHELLFAGLIEIIYQVRCMLVHGKLKPTEENHEVVKYCYLILHDLLKDFCE
jgi:hypothetical protein